MVKVVFKYYGHPGGSNPWEDGVLHAAYQIEHIMCGSAELALML